MKAISLFSGMGGDSLGMKRAGFEVIAHSEINPIFQKTHKLNFPKCELIGTGNISQTADDEFLKYEGIVQLIFAGFPCQSFSNAGNKEPNDPRNTLFKEFLRATKIIKPDYIVGENVKGLLSRKTSEGENYIDLIKEAFEEEGYVISYKMLMASEYGLPQKRERLFIVGIKKSIDQTFVFPEPTACLNQKHGEARPYETYGTLREPFLPNIGIAPFLNFDLEGAIRISKEDFDMTVLRQECILTDMENFEESSSCHPYLKLLAKRKNVPYKGKTHESTLSFEKRNSPIHGEIVNIYKPAKTIISTYARQPRLFVPLKNKKGFFLRCFLPDELKQIQGFPLDYKVEGNVSQQIIQIGNAVPPILVTKIVEELINPRSSSQDSLKLAQPEAKGRTPPCRRRGICEKTGETSGEAGSKPLHLLRMKVPPLVSVAKETPKQISDRRVAFICASINEGSLIGCEMRESYKRIFKQDIDRVSDSGGGCTDSYDLLIHQTDGSILKCEEKGTDKYDAQIQNSPYPWINSVQFFNGGSRSDWAILTKYGNLWWETVIQDGSLKQAYDIQSPIPSREEWVKLDAFSWGSPQTEFGKELKRVYRERHPGSSLNGKKNSPFDYRTEVSNAFSLSTEEYSELILTTQQATNTSMNVKDCWLQTTGKPETDFNFKWYRKCEPPKISSVIMEKKVGSDVKYLFKDEKNNVIVTGTLRFGGGTGFCNLRFGLA